MSQPTTSQLPSSPSLNPSNPSVQFRTSSSATPSTQAIPLGLLQRLCSYISTTLPEVSLIHHPEAKILINQLSWILPQSLPSTATKGINLLPKEVLDIIFEYFTRSDLTRLAPTSKLFNQHAQKLFWRYLRLATSDEDTREIIRPQAGERDVGMSAQRADYHPGDEEDRSRLRADLVMLASEVLEWSDGDVGRFVEHLKIIRRAGSHHLNVELLIRFSSTVKSLEIVYPVYSDRSSAGSESIYHTLLRHMGSSGIIFHKLTHVVFRDTTSAVVEIIPMLLRWAPNLSSLRVEVSGGPEDPPDSATDPSTFDFPPPDPHIRNTQLRCLHFNFQQIGHFDPFEPQG